MSSALRTDLRNILLQWQSGALKPQEVLEWAEGRYESEDLRSGDEAALSILTLLDSLHVNLITVEDVPVFLQMLELPPEKEEEASQLLERHSESFDLEARKKKYRDHPLYGLVCNDRGACFRTAASDNGLHPTADPLKKRGRRRRVLDKSFDNHSVVRLPLCSRAEQAVGDDSLSAGTSTAALDHRSQFHEITQV